MIDNDFEHLTDPAPDVITEPDNSSRRSFLDRIQKELCSPGCWPSLWKIENFIIAKHYESIVAECQRSENHPILCYDDEVLDALHIYWQDLQDPEKECRFLFNLMDFKLPCIKMMKNVGLLSNLLSFYCTMPLLFNSGAPI
ncbi:hypothetical protein GEMRC1_002180 [Eukaryota sp. GEM-RC1]